ncbi:hypothetical protein G6F22_020335 [Rhizopus arrhizus]|nr:hypothetical protein G6F22_020335 [Rhizopus arrhizus]
MARARRRGAHGDRGAAQVAVGFDGVREQRIAVAGDDQAVLRRVAARVVRQVVQLHIKEAGYGLADQPGRAAPVQPGCARQQLGAGVRHAQNAAGAVQRDRRFRVHVQKLG